MSNTDDSPLMVSIRCLVYNHEPYLRQCLDGFVMQKTNFRFEAIVHDDASTDNSAAIIREYAEKYPDIIKPVYEKENVYSKGQLILRRIMNRLCKGKYVAICDGDDYWTDPFKLQKQVDYMESHPDCSLCFTSVDVIYENGDPNIDNFVFAEQEKTDWYATEFTNHWFVASAGILHINDMSDYPYDPRFIAGDYPLMYYMLQKGYIHCINEKMVAYRRNINGVTFRTQNIQKLITYKEAIKEDFGKTYNFLDYEIVGLHLKAFRLGNFGKESWKALISILKRPRYTLIMFRLLPRIIFRSKKDDDKKVKYVIR